MNNLPANQKVLYVLYVTAMVVIYCRLYVWEAV